MVCIHTAGIIILRLYKNTSNPKHTLPVKNMHSDILYLFYSHMHSNTNIHRNLSHKWQQQVHLRSLLALNTTMDTRIPPAVMRCLVSRVCVQLVKLSSGHTGFSGRLQTSINSLQRNSNTHKFTLSRWEKPHIPPILVLLKHIHTEMYTSSVSLSLII